MRLSQVILLAGAVAAQGERSPCGSNETYTNCGNACFERKCCDNGMACYGPFVSQDTQSLWTQICPTVCQGRCECNPGYYRDPNSRQCVQMHQCTYYGFCGENEYWNECGSDCKEDKCSDLLNPYVNQNNILGSKTCSAACEQRCQCMPGFFRNDDGKCVQKSVCPHWNCLANETYQQCGNACMEPTCFVPDTTGRVCDTACQPRCQCDEGFVRDQHGNCVALGQCPSMYCQENEVYTNNYNPCNENSCTATFGCVAPAVIKSGCMCKEGFVRDQVSGKCVEYANCGCPNANEEFLSCGNQCKEPTCTDDKSTATCPTVCERRCQCKTGYVRASNGQCVRNEFCPSGVDCAANEYWNICGSSCAEPTCQNPNSRGAGAKTTCSQVCEARCECMAGFVRKGKDCVKAIDCEIECDLATEEFLTCGSACREAKCSNNGGSMTGARNPNEPQNLHTHNPQNDQTHTHAGNNAQSDILPHCPAVCERRCQCKVGFMRSKTGKCVATEAECGPQLECKKPNEVKKNICNGCDDKTCAQLISKEQCYGAQVCADKCVCKDGYARDASGNCVPEMQCLVCVGNQVPKMIKGACKGDEYCNGDTCFSPTVFNPNEKEYLTCVCKPGFKRDENDNCVDSCKPPCSDPLEVHDYVTDDCKKEEHCDPDSCASIMPVDPTWTCVCPHGTYRHEGKCVTECPKDPECGANEDPVELYCPCNERYCSNKGSRCSCGPGMKPGCICKEGFVRDGNNNCVPEYPYCAPPCNNPYEEFQMCPCDQECNKPKKFCSCDYVTPGCGCKKGYVRHPDGKCCDPSGCPDDKPCGGNCSADQIKKQIGGYGSKDAQCLTDGSKNGKGSVWKVSCNGKSATIKLGKKCKLSNPFCCGGSGCEPEGQCFCKKELESTYKDAVCNNGKWSCTDTSGKKITFNVKKGGKKCKKLMKKCKCARK